MVSGRRANLIRGRALAGLSVLLAATLAITVRGAWPDAAAASQARTSSAPSRSNADTLRDKATKRLAQLDGSVNVPGLDSAVEVRRDRWGVPHIYARTEHDLFFAQGFVAAQDRLWQMEMWRRQGEGRLAEVLGPRAVERDRLARLFRYRGSKDAEWAAYGPNARAIVGAFVAGVNAYIAQVKDRPPIEFTMMGFAPRSEEHTSELQSPCNLVCRLLLEKKKRTPCGRQRSRGAARGPGAARCQRSPTFAAGHACSTRTRTLGQREPHPHDIALRC